MAADDPIDRGMAHSNGRMGTAELGAGTGPFASPTGQSLMAVSVIVDGVDHASSFPTTSTATVWRPRAVATLQPTRQSREELRTRLVEEGREILLVEGLEAGSSNLTFKRVFARVEAKTGMRITNASVIKRIWENQADFQADVLVSIARDEAHRAEGSGQRVVAMLGALDMTTPESRTRALREVCRVEGNASSLAIDQSTNWPLWISVIAMATSSANPDVRTRIKAALADGYLSVTRFWSQNFIALIDVLGLRVRHPWSMDQFSMAAIAYAEGCALRQLTSGHTEMTIRPTGPDEEDQEWSPFAVGLEALVYQFLEPDPEFMPPS